MRLLAGDRVLSAGPLFWLLDTARFGAVKRQRTTVAGAHPSVRAGWIRWCLGAAVTPRRDCKRILGGSKWPRRQRAAAAVRPLPGGRSGRSESGSNAGGKVSPVTLSLGLGYAIRVPSF
jgi:hypothetical protein